MGRANFTAPTICNTAAAIIDRLIQLRDPKSKKLDYNSELWREISRQVKIRDTWRCTSCKSNRHLEVHHRVSVRSGGTHQLNNLVTLCSRCHHARHQEQLRKVQYGQKYSGLNPAVGVSDLR